MKLRIPFSALLVLSLFVWGCGDSSSSDDSCTPSQTRCTSDGNLETCNATGTGWNISTCDDGCANGVCLISCTPGETKCDKEIDLWTCNPNGDAWEVTSCPAGCSQGACN